jgi:hypothetical protein
MGDREERIARNEALFRDLNERTKEIAESLTPGQPPRVLEIFCECGKADCVEKVALAMNEYEAVRANSTRFIVAAGHEIPDVEDVVAREDGYCIVKKHEEEAAIAREVDPRSSAG